MRRTSPIANCAAAASTDSPSPATASRRISQALDMAWNWKPQDVICMSFLMIRGRSSGRAGELARRMVQNRLLTPSWMKVARNGSIPGEPLPPRRHQQGSRGPLFSDHPQQRRSRQAHG